MGQRKMQHPRCPACYLHVELCLCDRIPRLEVRRTSVVLVMHRRELHKPTNTGRLALLTLSDAHLALRGRQGEVLDLTPYAGPERRSLVLFPREDAVPLDAALLDADPRPLTLFVPDGTWAQARRVVRRDPILQAATAVLVPPGPPTRYRLRREHQLGGLATAEAMARALRVIEGDHVADGLEALFELMIERSLATRDHDPNFTR